MTDLPALRRILEEDDGWIHGDKLEELGVDRWPLADLKRSDPIPEPLACPYCNAAWTPEMFELLEQSGYCETCSDVERVIDVFCTACTRLVYRKEGY